MGRCQCCLQEASAIGAHVVGNGFDGGVQWFRHRAGCCLQLQTPPDGVAFGLLGSVVQHQLVVQHQVVVWHQQQQQQGPLFDAAGATETWPLGCQVGDR